MSPCNQRHFPLSPAQTHVHVTEKNEIISLHTYVPHVRRTCLPMSCHRDSYPLPQTGACTSKMLSVINRPPPKSMRVAVAANKKQISTYIYAANEQDYNSEYEHERRARP